MRTFRFLDFPVYQDSRRAYFQVRLLTAGLKDYNIKDQVQRAALSVVLNIAEGSARKSDKDFARFLQISLGSVNEVVACLDILKSNRQLDEEQFEALQKACEVIARQLGGLSKTLTQGR